MTCDRSARPLREQPGREAKESGKRRVAERGDRYLAMALLIATVLSSLFGFSTGAGPLVAALGQTAFLLFGAAFLLVAGRLWFWPENPDDE